MRKHSARKWLHFIIDLLPLFILPIFAIWEINHNDNQSISVQVDNKEVVDFNQLVNFADKTFTRYGLSVSITDNAFNVQGTADNSTGVNLETIYTGSSSTNGLYPIINHYYVIKNRTIVGSPNSIQVTANGLITLENIGNDSLVRASQSAYPFYVNLRANVSGSYFDTSQTINIFDLTQMYGSGNEPSLQDFLDTYSGFSPYVVSHKELVTNGTITYENTDIGSQMLYAIYKPVQQYFNFDNIFNFGAIRNWFELNLFHGNMGIPMTIVWNVIIYEFISDIIMLVYMVFMFFIDFATDTLERFTGWGRKGD